MEFGVVAIAVGLVLGFGIALLLFLCIRWYKRRSNLKNTPSNSSVSTLPIRSNGPHSTVDISASIADSVNASELIDSQKNFHFPWWSIHSKDPVVSNPGVQRYSFKEIQKATHNFTSMLGEGSFGPVYKAVMPSGDVVAVKALASNSKQGEREFQTEVALLGRLHHRNLVNLLGYCVEKGHRMLIYEFLSKGNLANLLYNEDDAVLTWEQRLQIALDVAHGIEYLHEGAVPSVLHRDLKSANILVDQSLRAKVADFGFSKEETLDSRRKSSLKGTYGYIDPVYVSTTKFTKRSDVYSFGIILFELITAIHPHQNLMEYINLASMSQDGVDEVVDKRLGGMCDLEEVRDLAGIAHKCLHMFPGKRPSIAEVLQGIAKIKQKNVLRRSFSAEEYSRHVSRIAEQQAELQKMTSNVHSHEIAV